MKSDDKNISSLKTCSMRKIRNSVLMSLNSFFSLFFSPCNYERIYSLSLSFYSSSIEMQWEKFDLIISFFPTKYDLMILDEEWSNWSSSTSTIIHTSSSTKTTGRFPWTSIFKWSMYSQISRYSSIEFSSIQLVKYLPTYSCNHLCSLLSNYYYFYFYLSQVNLHESSFISPIDFFLGN